MTGRNESIRIDEDFGSSSPEMVEPGVVLDGSEEELRVNILTRSDESVIEPARIVHEPSFVDKPEELSGLPTEGLEAERDTEENVAEQSLAAGTRENGGTEAHSPDTEIEILQELYQRKCKECEGLKKTIAFLRQAVREADDLLYEKSCEIEQMEFRIQSVTYLHEEKKEDTIKTFKEKSKKKKNKKKEARRPMRSKMPPTPEGERKRNNNDPKQKRKTTKLKEEPNEEQKTRRNENRKSDEENYVRNQNIKPKPESTPRKPKEDFEKSERTKRKEALLASLSARQIPSESELSSGPIEQELQGCERREEAIIIAKKDATIENRSNGIVEVNSTNEELLTEISTGESEEQIRIVTHGEDADETMSTSEEATIKVSVGAPDVEEIIEERPGHSDRLEDNCRRLDIAEQIYYEETSLNIPYPTLLDGDSSSTRDCISEMPGACTPQCVASDDVDSADHVTDGYALSAEDPEALAPQPSDLVDESNLPHFTDENTVLFSHETQNLVIDLDELDCEAMGSSSQGNSSQSNKDVSHSVEPASSFPSANISDSDAPLPSTNHDLIKISQANEPVVVRVEI